ncbi:MAG: hypothetical protein KAK00_00030 [Nanoarchaeota archaeon]|nr:hypothetical protein [Nanoarchaeota archaeon]
MVKITKANKQLRINIPKEIAELKGWDEHTDLSFIPFLQNPDSKLDKDTPLLIKEIDTKKKQHTDH